MQTCPECGKRFDPSDRASALTNAGAEAQILYCSVQCQRRARNRRPPSSSSAWALIRLARRRSARHLRNITSCRATSAASGTRPCRRTSTPA